MQRLHERGRDHIWAYYTRNIVRPVALSRARVDRTIAKSGGLAIKASDGLGWTEGAGLGSQGHGHPEGKPSFQAQRV